MQGLLFFPLPLPLLPCFRSRSYFLDGLSRKRLLRKLTFPTPSIRLQFRFEIWEILHVQWLTVHSGCTDLTLATARLIRATFFAKVLFFLLAQDV